VRPNGPKPLGGCFPLGGAPVGRVAAGLDRVAVVEGVVLEWHLVEVRLHNAHAHDAHAHAHAHAYAHACDAGTGADAIVRSLRSGATTTPQGGAKARRLRLPRRRSVRRRSPLPMHALRRAAALWRAMASCGELWRAVASCGELWRAVASCGEMWRDVASYGELCWAGAP
jgi:hypothetical protein